MRLPSGLSPSVLEFHQLNRPTALVLTRVARVADYHRRFRFALTPGTLLLPPYNSGTRNLIPAGADTDPLVAAAAKDHPAGHRLW